MTLQILSEKLLVLVAEDAAVECLGGGFQFTEGPVWNPGGAFLLFSDIPGDARARWDERDGIRVIASPTNNGNGMALDRTGQLLVCEHRTKSVARMDPDGTGAGREVLASHYGNRVLNSPNDVVVRSDGSIYFTDPAHEPPFRGPEELDFQGVYRLAPDGSGPELLADDFSVPNGLCFSPDESLLYVNDTTRAHIRVFGVGGEGSLDAGRVFAEGIGTGERGTPSPDGMKCDVHGNVWITGPGGIWVFDPHGAQLGVLEIPERVGNLAFGGHDGRSLLVTATTSLYRVATRIEGAA